MLVGLAALLGALAVLIPVAVKGYIDITQALRQVAKIDVKVDEGFQRVEESQAETKHLVNSHLDHIMEQLRKMTEERNVLRDEAKGKQ